MTASGGADPRGSSADLTALPAAIAQQSLSTTRIILPVAAAAQAIELLTANGRRLESWEGWVHLTDGGRTKSLTYGGSFALPRDAERAAAAATAAIQRAQAQWDRDPEYPGCDLYFGLSFG